MIPLSEEDYIIMSRGNFECKFKPPIDKIETELMQLSDNQLNIDPDYVKDRKKFEESRKVIRDFLSLSIVEIKQKKEGGERIFEGAAGISFIPFALLMVFYRDYINSYNLSIGELKNL